MSAILFWSSMWAIRGAANDPDAGGLFAVLFDQVMETVRIINAEADTAMRGRAAKFPGRACAVNGNATIKEHRIGHWGVFIFLGIVHLFDRMGTERAARR